ncbi:hypothetical protein GGS21DRAFT_545391 [Xylaria nigripes]|nr:hypothetical protein GGS21DRAFT_545391 [Xylaria nigripes]
MESFSLAASHAGAIQHNHVIRFDVSTIAAVRELRIAVTVIVAGWVAITGLRAYFRNNRIPSLHTPRSPEHPYWGTLQSPSTSNRNSRTSRVIDDLTADRPRTEPVNTRRVHARRDKDAVRLRREGHRYGREPTNSKSQGPKTSKREKRFGLADPIAWDVINRSLTQQHRLSSLIIRDDPVAVPIRRPSKKATDAPSRTSSQRKALNRFARELEKYADAAGAADRVPIVTPTTSESKVSVHTVKPLVPYKNEFRAAGLAVTSAEQSRHLACNIHAQASIRRKKSHTQSSEASRARKKLDRPMDSTSSGMSASTSCTSSGSYVDFSPIIGHMIHDIEPLVPRKTNRNSRSCQRTRKRLLSWFLKKPSSRHSSIHGRHIPVRIQHVKGGQLQSDDVSASQLENNRPQHRSHKPTMQSIPEIQLPLEPGLPAKYVTPKKDPCVALANVRCEQSDQGRHPEQDGMEHPPVIDAKQSLSEVGLQGRRNLTMGVLPKPYPEPIGTIKEETETAAYTVEKNETQARCPSPMRQRKMPSVIGATRRRPDVVSSVTHESSIPSLPFTARLAIRTTSSLQQALDDAYQKVDEESKKTDSQSEREDVKPEPLRNAGRDSHRHALPRKPRSTDRFIYVKRNMPRVEAIQPISKPLPPEPLSTGLAKPEDRSEMRSSQPSPKALPPAPSGERKDAVAELSKAEEMLKDLDLFLNDHDDANIEDRDVIKGLQVAIHAAADDLYDGYIRHRTGLRIRRFLADLKSFEEISELGGSIEQRSGKGRC